MDFLPAFVVEKTAWADGRFHIFGRQQCSASPYVFIVSSSFSFPRRRVVEALKGGGEGGVAR